MEQKSNSTLIVLVIILAVVVVGGIYLWQTSDVEPSSVSTPVQGEKSLPEPAGVSLEKLNTLVATLKVEDPEEFSYLGCAIIHGPDGSIDSWEQFDETYLENLYSFLNSAASKFTLIKLDYSQNPSGVSDQVSIVTCSCEDFEEAHNMIAEMTLNFPDLLWHTEDRENDPMTPCLGEQQFG